MGVVEEKLAQEEPIIHLAFKGLAFIGNAKPGYNLDCKGCGHGLVRGAYEQQILGLKIECPVCEVLNPTQKRKKGESIPTRVVVLKSSGSTKGGPMPAEAAAVSGLVKPLKKPVILHAISSVGEPELRNYQREVGVGSSAPQSEELTADYLKSIATKAINLMGENLYKRNLSTYRKSASSKTPKPTTHRLVGLIQYVLSSSKRLDKSGRVEPVEIDGNLLSEIVTVVNMFERWRNHPACEDLRKSLANSNDVQHSLMQMLVASYLADQGQGVSLVFKKDEGKRIPDITVKPTFMEVLQVEIKTPVKLHGPIDTLKQSEATQVIEKALTAASAKRGQIDPKHTGIVAICGFHLGQDTLDILEKTATDILQRQSKRKIHLIAVMICALSYRSTETIGVNQEVAKKSFSPVIKVKTVRHRGYKGGLTLKT